LIKRYENWTGKKMNENSMIDHSKLNPLILARKVVQLLFGMLAFAVLSMIMVSAIPNTLVNDKVNSSLALLDEEGLYHYAFFDPDENLQAAARSDGFTERVMIVSAITDPNMSTIENTMSVSGYPRFWHGYLVVLKPLLILFDLPVLRTLCCVSFLLLFALAVYQIANQISLSLALCFCFAFSLFNVPIIMISLQFSITFLLTLLACNVLLFYLPKKLSPYWVPCFFLVCGGATIFFEFLTSPLITLGLPLTLYLAYQVNEKQISALEQVKQIIMLGLLWLLGYSFIWFMKWVIASLVLDSNVIEDAVNQMRLRTVTDVGDPLKESPVELIGKLFSLVPFPALVPLAVISLLVALFIKIARKENTAIVSSLPMLLVVFIPFVWFTVLHGHTARHFWFVYRELLVSYFAAFTLLWQLFTKRSAKRLPRRST
jgi:hypothetical protein